MISPSDLVWVYQTARFPCEVLSLFEDNGFSFAVVKDVGGGRHIVPASWMVKVPNVTPKPIDNQTPPQA